MSEGKMKKTITLKESELISLIERMINEYGEDSGGQDMTYGMYKRDNKGLGQSIDFRMMSPMNVALEIEDVLPENYIEVDVEKAVDNYIEDSSINIEVAKKYMKDEDWWDTLYYNIKDIRDRKSVNEDILPKNYKGGIIKESKNNIPGKTVGDLKNILSKANPKGFLIMVDGDNSNWITNIANLNVETYGYKLNGVDITQDNGFVGLPYYEDACLSDVSDNDSLYLDSEVISIKKYKHIFPIKDIMNRLNEYSDNDYLMLFDGCLVEDIKLNGKTTVGFKNIYGQKNTFISKPNDFVYIIKGEKTKSFFRRSENKKSLEEETGTSSVGGFEPALDQPIRKKIRTGLTKEEFNQLKEYMKMDMFLEEGKKKTGTKLCARGKAAAKAKFKVYPSAYANGFAVQVCKGRMKGLDGQKKCSGSYC